MTTIELPIRSLSVLFLFSSIALLVWFPDKPFTPDLALALFWMFLSLGAVRWAEDALLDFLPDYSDKENRSRSDGENFWMVCRIVVSVIALVAFVWFLILGILGIYDVIKGLI